MLTLKDMRAFVDKCSHLHDDTVICVIEENPTPDFDNSGFNVNKLTHERVAGDGDDLGIIYIHASGLEENTPWKPE